MRGKHGISAAARQAVGDREKQIESYQHNIRKLTAENAELKQKIADMQEAHSKTVRVLKAERDEGLSPQLTVLSKENERMRERVDKAERDYRHIQKLWVATFNWMRIHFIDAHGCTPLEATETVLNATPEIPGKDGETGTFRLVEEPSLRELNRKKPGAAAAIQRARGERR